MANENEQQTIKDELLSTVNMKAEEESTDLSVDAQQVFASGAFRLPKGFDAINRLVLRDLNNNITRPSFSKYTKDRITTFLNDPYTNEKSLREAVIYIYNTSSYFRRLIQYFVSLSDYSYIVTSTRIDSTKANVKTTRNNYHKVLNLLSGMDIKNQCPKIVTVCMREDVYYGTMRTTSDSVIFQQLPSDYCSIAFDFSYFDTNSNMLPMYPEEFRIKYELYKRDPANKIQELDAPNSFAIKCNTDILDYAIPPFAGLLREIYDLEDYKALKLTKTTLENYAMLVMHLGRTNGDWDLPFEQAREFWSNMDHVVPEEIGTILSPMEITKIGFEKSNVGDTNTVADAERNLYGSAGVSSLLFDGNKSSANALLLSIKNDQAMTYGIVKSIEGAINRFLRRQSFGKNFKITFLNCSAYNRDELGDAYLKACQYGMPMVSYYCASQGLAQDEMDSMNFLEDRVLDIKNKFIPLRSSATQSSVDSTSASPGRPQADADELTEAGETTREES